MLLAFFIVAMYWKENIVAVNIIVAALLLITDLFVERLLVKFRINSLLLLGIAALLVMLATRQGLFPLFLMVIALVVKYSYIDPMVEFSEKGVFVKRTFHLKKHDWAGFSNIILKDNLLTLDFKNNKVLQLELDNSVKIDEQQFNDFCVKKILQ